MIAEYKAFVTLLMEYSKEKRKGRYDLESMFNYGLATLSMPRQAGNTTAAIELLDEYPTAILLSLGYDTNTPPPKKAKYASRAFDSKRIKGRQWRKFHDEMMRGESGTMARLRGTNEMLIIDAAYVHMHELSEILEVTKFELILLTGGATIIS